MRILFFLLFLPTMAMADPPVAVTLQPASELLYYPRREATATTTPLRQATLSAEIPGRIAEILVETGDVVQAGTPLLRLDDREYRLALAQNQALVHAGQQSLELANKQLERTRTLRAKGQASSELLDQRETEARLARSDLENRQANLDLAQLHLEKSAITAPFPGVIVERHGQEGSWVDPGTPLFSLLDPAALELTSQVDPLLADELPRARNMAFESQGERFAVSLRAILPMRHPQARTREIRMLFAGDKPEANASGRLTWESPIPHLPAWLPVRREGELGVFFADNGKARFVALPGALEGAPAPMAGEVTGELVVEGRESLSQGRSVILPGKPPE